MAGPQHSFAVLAHGESPYLENCVRSLEGQTLPSRIFCVTSTPTPELVARCRRHGIALAVNPEPAGIASDWSYAYRSATTQYLTLAHQDDTYHPRYTETMLRRASGSLESVICFSDYTERSADADLPTSTNLAVKRTILLAFFVAGPRLGQRAAKRMLLSLGSPICCPSVLYNRSAIGDLSFASHLQINLDWDAWFRLADIPGYFQYVPERLLMHRLHPGAATWQGIASRRRAQEDAQLFRYFWPGPVAAALSALYALSYRLPP